MDDEEFGTAANFNRRGAAISAVRPAFVVEAEEPVELGVGVDERDVILEVNLLVFDRAPQPLDKNVADCPTATVHRQPHRGALEDGESLGVGELAALVGVEDLGIAELGDGPTQGAGAESGVEGVGQFPGQNAVVVPVHDRN